MCNSSTLKRTYLRDDFDNSGEAIVQRYPANPADPDFPSAHQTQAWSLIPARQDDLNKMLNEFRHARETCWAEWVAARTPFGAEARSIQDRIFERYFQSSAASNAEIVQLQQELRDLLFRIDNYFYPSNDRPDAVLIGEALLHMLFGHKTIRFILSFFVFSILFNWNPFNWHSVVQFIASLILSGLAYQAFGFLFRDHGSRIYVPGLGYSFYTPGIGFRVQSNLDLGESSLQDELARVQLYSADDVYAFFGDWKYLAPKWRLGFGAKLLRPRLVKSHMIRFKPLLSDLNLKSESTDSEHIPTNVYSNPFWPTTVGEQWNVGESDLHSLGLQEGPCILFVYRTNYANEERRYVPFGLFDFQTRRTEFFDTARPPYDRWFVILSLALVVLWVGISSSTFFGNVWPFLICCLLGWFVGDDDGDAPYDSRALMVGLLCIPVGMFFSAHILQVHPYYFFSSIWPPMFFLFAGWTAAFYAFRLNFRMRCSEALSEVTLPDHVNTLYAEYTRLKHSDLAPNNGRL